MRPSECQRVAVHAAGVGHAIEHGLGLAGGESVRTVDRHAVEHVTAPVIELLPVGVPLRLETDRRRDLQRGHAGRVRPHVDVGQLPLGGGVGDPGPSSGETFGESPFLPSTGSVGVAPDAHPRVLGEPRSPALVGARA